MVASAAQARRIVGDDRRCDEASLCARLWIQRGLAQLAALVLWMAVGGFYLAHGRRLLVRQALHAPLGVLVVVVVLELLIVSTLLEALLAVISLL